MTLIRTAPEHMRAPIERAKRLLAMCVEADQREWDGVTFGVDHRHSEIVHYFSHDASFGSLVIPDRIALEIIAGGVPALRRWTWNPASYIPEKP